MSNTILKYLSLISDNLWLTVVILVSILGIYFTFTLKGIQFNVKRMIKYLFKKDNTSPSGLSSFKTLSIALAGRIGVGSISGIALAIYLGGPGTIFWIWIIAIISAIIAYSETYLGVKYKEKGNDGIHNGGPEFYINKVLHKPKLAKLYILVFAFCYVFGFNSVQSNTITKAISHSFNLTPWIVSLCIAIFTFIVVFKGQKKVADATSKLVPFMSLLYIIIAIIVIIKNITIIPNIFTSIIRNALNIKPFVSGFLSTMIIGTKRGIFSNEAGLGTGSIAAASGNSDDAIKEGFIQMFGIYITSIIICTCTGLIVLSSNYNNLIVNDPNGIEIASSSFIYHLGTPGNTILTIIITLFAFSTILSGYYYGISALKYLFKKDYSILLKIATIIIVFLGGIISSTISWTLTDLLIAILVIINIISIFFLRKEIQS